MGCDSSSMTDTTVQPKKGGKITVTYFPFHGRSDALRMMFHHLKLDHENVDVTKTEWTSKVAKGEAGEFGFLPMVQVGDKKWQCT